MKKYLTVLLLTVLQAALSAEASEPIDLGTTISVRSIRSDVQDVHERPDAKFIDENFSFFYQMKASERDLLAGEVVSQLLSALMEAAHAEGRSDLHYFPFATINVSDREGSRSFVTDGCYARDSTTGHIVVLDERWRRLLGALSSNRAEGQTECP